MQDKRHDVEVPGFQAYTFGGEEASLKGQGTLTSGSLSFRTRPDDGLMAALTRHHVYSLDVVVARRAEPGSVLQVFNDGDTAEATLSLYVSDEQFRAFVEHPSSVLKIGFRSPDDDAHLVDGIYTRDVHIVFLSATQYLNAPSVDHYRSFDAELTPFILRAQGSQLARIARELLESVERGIRERPVEASSRGAHLHTIASILSGLRSAVPRVKADAAVLLEDPDEFRKRIEALDKQEAERLSNLYDNVWQHKWSASLIQSGKFEQADTGELSTDTVDEVARDYLSRPMFSSAALEWLLIDALLFNETIAFARSIAWLPPGKPWPQFRYQVLRSGAWWFKEAIRLGLTFLLAQFVDSGHGVGFWVIMGTISAVRWLRPDPTINERAKVLQLLADMSTVQNSLQIFDFNSRLLRDRLYDVARRGAEFNQSVYSLLDKRIAREDVTRR